MDWNMCFDWFLERILYAALTPLSIVIRSRRRWMMVLYYAIKAIKNRNQMKPWNVIRGCSITTAWQTATSAKFLWMFSHADRIIIFWWKPNQCLYFVVPLRSMTARYSQSIAMVKVLHWLEFKIQIEILLSFSRNQFLLQTKIPFGIVRKCCDRNKNKGYDYTWVT